jgi:hypothetical protein
MAALVQFGSFIFVTDSALTSFLSVLGRRLAVYLRVFVIGGHAGHLALLRTVSEH